MKQEIVQIITAGIGTLGFSIYFRVSEKNVIASTLGVAAAWAIYLLIYKLTGGLFVSNFTAALVIYIYSEIMARFLKALSNIFLILGIIPLLPGGALYYTMYGLVSSDSEMFVQNGINTVVITFGIAAGIVVGVVMLIYISKIQSKIK
ncbi:MAG: threonine/serine exporter family protein [Clostridiales bacterium]|nr:threonine/serine exporter family protein [Clostridiales bacterium]